MSHEASAVLARKVELTYRSGRVGLNPLDLEVDVGQVVAVLGPNGSGKSTLLRLLATDLRPTEGELSLLGCPVRGGLAALRRRIGFAPDTPVHFEVLTGMENAEAFRTLVPTPSTVRPGPNPTTSRGDRSSELFRAFDLEDVSMIPVSEYSFGMSRKLLLLEAVAMEPDLLLLDEPSVGLDPRGMWALRAAVRETAESGGTVVVASNEVRDVPTWADRVLFFHRGELVEDAPLSDLLNRLEGRTRIEVDLAETGSLSVDMSEIQGVESSTVTSTGVVAESSQGGSPLPALVQTIHSAGHRIRDIRVREPDLSDLFESLTGESLLSPERVPAVANGSAP